MKSKFLLSILLFFVLSTSQACPVWRIGKMYIVDEQKRPIAKAVVWKYFTMLDSHKMRKGERYNYTENDSSRDTNVYEFWTGGLRIRSRNGKEVEQADKYLRIQAEGYADVTIKSLQFKSGDDDDDVPVVYVTMYAKKYLTKGNLITIIDQYVCNRELVASDSLRVGMSDYMQVYRSENAVAAASRNAAFMVKAYPNPVIDKLNVSIQSTVVKPYLAKVLDIQGKLVSETQLCTSLSEINMEWESSGLYVVSIYNPEGVLLYSLKFSKS